MANALERVPTDLEDASAMLGGGLWTTLRRVTIPLVLPAMLAGSLIAILQALTMFGSPAILALPAGFHVITTKIWSLFQYPPKPGPRRRRGAAAAAHHHLPAVGAEPHPRPARLHHARRQERRRRASPRSAAGAGSALAFVGFVLSLTVILPYAALLKTALTRTVAEPLTLRDAHAAPLQLRVLRILGDAARHVEHASCSAS